MTRGRCTSVGKGQTGRGEGSRASAGGAMVVGQEDETWAGAEANFQESRRDSGFSGVERYLWSAGEWPAWPAGEGQVGWLQP